VKLFMTLLVILESLALAGIRLAGNKSEAFQAIAHLWVAGLFAWGIKPPRDWWLIGTAAIISLVELVAFFTVK
jgi:hypothetical protein